MVTSRKPAPWLAVLDAISLIAVFNIIALARGITDAETLIVLPLLLPFLFLVFALYLTDGYKAQTDMLSVDYTSQHILGLISAMLATLLVTFVFIPGNYTLQQSRAVIAISFLALVPVTLIYRRLFYQQILKRRRNRHFVFLGDEKSCAAFRVECEKLKLDLPVIYSTPNEPLPPTPGDTAPAPIPFSEVLRRMRAGEISVEALVLRESNRDFSDALSRELVELYFDGVPSYTLELFHQVYWRKIPTYRLNQTWLFQEGFQMAREPVFARLKRFSDLLLATLALIVFVPVIALAGLAIWLEDRGPIFFQQTRIGKNRVPFRLIKLRTMRVSDGPGDLYTRKGDSRITKIGGFLRKSRIDEFPQIFNVLRGEMSLIGPRAEWDRLVETYQTQIPCYHFRHLVNPGITGWAQVSYPYGANLDDTIRKLEYDLYYIRHFSFILDAAIVLKTVHIMLFGKGR